MTAARYWRIVAVDTYAGGDLELGEVALYEGATRVDGNATITSTFAPTIGMLSDLSDVDAGTTVRWADADLRRPSFSVTWDFGASQVVSSVTFKGQHEDLFPSVVTLQSSSDGFDWITEGASTPVQWPGPCVESKAAPLDPHYESVVLLVRGAPSIDYSPRRRSAASVSGGYIYEVDSPTKHTPTSVRTTGWGAQNWAYLAGASSDFSLNHLRWTIETWVWGDPGTPGGLCCSRRGGASGWAWTRGGLRASINGSWSDTQIAHAEPTDGVWHHHALCRIDSTILSLIDGKVVGQLDGVTYIDSDYPFLNLGASNAISQENALRGFFSEFRWTLGVSRYPEGFTPPGSELYWGRSSYAPVRAKQASGILLRDDVLGPTRIVGVPKPLLLDIYDAGPGRIAGTVKEKTSPVNAPLKRRVVLLSMPGSRPIRETWSDPVTGTYEFQEVATDRPYTVISYDHTGNYRGVVSDNLRAELMP